MANILKQAISFLLPLTVAVLIPSRLLSSAVPPVMAHPTLLLLIAFAVGAICSLAGLYTLVFTVRTFILIGKGTLAPWSPTTRLIVGGVYGHVRNPMITGVFFILLGETLLFWSWRLLTWSALFLVINHLYFILSEEPGLAKRFGDEYRLYQQQVPRWIPRRRPWKPD